MLLAVGHEGADVAKWLNEKGVTAFVLKYRLSHDDPAHPENNFVTLLKQKILKNLIRLMLHCTSCNAGWINCNEICSRACSHL